MAEGLIIQARHLARLFYVYIRQSTMKQVKTNTGSRAAQLAQVDEALRLGWKRENIRLADKDGGKSGTTTAGRLSYQDMVRDLQAGLVGGIGVIALDRAGRDDIELQILLRECVWFDAVNWSWMEGQLISSTRTR